jgi:hypothetical protein
MRVARISVKVLIVPQDQANKMEMVDDGAIKLDPAPGQIGTRRSPVGVRGVEIYQFPWMCDPRGSLTVGEFGEEFPFLPKRYFIVFGVPAGMVRGEHAHKRCHQFLICAQGQCNVQIDDGVTRREVVLTSASTGLYVPPLIWGAQHKFSADGALVVFASDPYDPDDYIRDYTGFQAALRAASV